MNIVCTWCHGVVGGGVLSNWLLLPFTYFKNITIIVISK